MNFVELDIYVANPYLPYFRGRLVCQMYAVMYGFQHEHNKLTVYNGMYFVQLPVRIRRFFLILLSMTILCM
jgi:hypothetical protein